MTAVIVGLSEVGRGDLVVAGGKGANLGELLRAGFRVPGGFVVTTQAYADVVEAARFDVDALLAAGDAAGIRAAIESLEVPATLRQELAAAYARLGAGPVAVRSSATAEDLPGAAFAGQQDTYLGVLGLPALVDAVRSCWASLWTDRAIAYREQRRVASAGVRLAVVVQRMVEADVAGVLFTADPVSGNRDAMIVDASPGLGEAVVSGLVTPDHYVLDRAGRIREHTAGRREVVVRSAPGGGVVADTGGEQRGDSLSQPDLAELARTAAAVAELFGRPQDIEWAYADGKLWLLQARPLTALPPPPLRLGPVARSMGAILLELIPYRPYPIDMSTWWPSGPVGLMANMTAHFGIRAFVNLLTERDGVVEAFTPRTPRLTPTFLLAPFRIAALARRYHPKDWTQDPRFAAYLAQARALRDQDLADLDWRRLVRMPRQALDLIGPMTALRTDYLPGAVPALLRLSLLLGLLGRRDLMPDLLLGGGSRTEDANRGLAALAGMVRTDPRLREAVASGDADRLATFGEFQAALVAFLDEFGHRETSTALLATSPTWGESPRVVLDLVSALAAGPPHAADQTRGDAALRRLLRHPLLRYPPLRGPRCEAAFRRWVDAARSAMALREDTHFYLTLPLPPLRRALLEIGRRLTGAGILAEPEDVYHLRLEELEPLEDPDLLADADQDRLRELVRARSARREELAGVRLIDPAAIYPRRDTGDALVTGTPAGGGRASGPVAVIAGPHEFGRLRAGDVLVAAQTNPSWTPLFQLAAAVVVDSGGPVSHAAIVAREYGIPAVMGTRDGTAVLTEGQWVTVDGDRGRVTAAPDSAVDSANASSPG